MIFTISLKTFHWSPFPLQLLLHFSVPRCAYTCQPLLLSFSFEPSLVRFSPILPLKWLLSRSLMTSPIAGSDGPSSVHIVLEQFPPVELHLASRTPLSLGSPASLLAPLLLFLTSKLCCTLGFGPQISSLFYLHSHPT